jgi:hypothetical protein
MHRLGYSVQLGQLGRDGGVDVFAERPSEVGDELVLIQCKQFRVDRKVGEPIIKQLHADVHYRSATRINRDNILFFIDGAHVYRTISIPSIGS